MAGNLSQEQGLKWGKLGAQERKMKIFSSLQRVQDTKPQRGENGSEYSWSSSPNNLMQPPVNESSGEKTIYGLGPGSLLDLL